MKTGDATFRLTLKPDLAEAEKRWLAFWEHELIDRPLCAVTAPRDGVARAAFPPYMAGAREAFGPVAAQALAAAEAVYWAGEAIPCYSPSFGPDMLVHLDDACAIPGLEWIQWQPGVRNGPFIKWLDLLKRTQSKGVAVYVPCSVDDIKVYHRELNPALVYYHCSAPTQTAADGILQWLGENT